MTGWKLRRDRAKARLDRNRSAETQLIRAVRAGAVAVEEAGQTARRDYGEMNQPVRSPIGETCHPQVANLVAAFLSEQGIVDVHAPIDGETLEAMVSRYCEEARTAHDAAVQALRELEIEKAQRVVDAASAKLASVQNICTAVGAVTDTPLADPVEPKRPRTRPRVAEDEGEPVIPV